MKQYAPDAIRNIAVAGHSGAGKTSLLDLALFVTGQVDRAGRVDDGTSVLDYDPDETKRKISINTAIAPCEWHNHKINFVDTPGYPDFVGDVIGALRVCEGALIVVDAVSGIEVGTETAWSYAQEAGSACAILINRMDRENADFGQVLNALRERYGQHVVPMHVPIGAHETFKGLVDLVQMKAFVWDGGKMSETAVPDDLSEMVKAGRTALVEAAAEMDDALMEKYFGEGDLPQEDLSRGLTLGVKAGRVVPVLVSSASKGIGIEPLMEFAVSVMPSPTDRGSAKGTNPHSGADEERKPTDDAFSALVFKTMADPYVGKLNYFRVYSGALKSDSQMYNVNKDREERVGQVYFVKGKQQEATPSVGAGDIGAIAKLQETSTGDTLCDKAKPISFVAIHFPEPVFELAIQAQSKADEDKLGPALAKLSDEDPTFRFRREAETGQTIIGGLGESHLDIVVDKLKRKFGVSVNVELPKIPYRETIQAKAEAQGRHKKQTGGRGQFGDCWIRMEPLPRGAGFEYVDEVVGGAIPRQYIPAVEKGVREAAERGVVAGYPTVDFKVTVYDGSFHPVDSSEQAFKTAGTLAFQAAAAKASPVLLEPIMEVEVVVPDEYMGDVMGDLNSRRGRIQGMDSAGGGKQRIRAVVPEAEMQRYAIDLRSIARGRGWFRAQRTAYEEVPAHIAQNIIAEAKKAREES